MIGNSLRSEGYDVVEASNGMQALSLMEKQPPDLVVLDIVMPEMDGIDVCQRMRANDDLAKVPILFVTARSELTSKIKGFETGGDDYLVKPFDLDELSLRIKALLRRSQGSGPGEKPAQLQAASLSLDLRNYQVQTKDKTVLLSPMEFKLLRHLMSHAGELFSSERLLQEVWGYPPGTGDPALVRWHVRNLRSMIEPSPHNPIYLLTVPRHGYVVRCDRIGS